MQYRKLDRRYKYVLEAPEFFVVPLLASPCTVPGFLELDHVGRLIVASGYAWDGASGPAFNTETIMRGSLLHDALYQLIREGLLPPVRRRLADQQLRRVCLEDGMWPLRAWWVYWSVRLFGRGAVGL